ncbi:acanthoscurrin-2-like [Ochlerotatus camptorhynchus]|uniref:acanthoscurrin-2-like n=1 Tax=Ochlerotatus camptorhynchus TaxID=644619 RepID=UPI0031D82C41
MKLTLLVTCAVLGVVLGKPAENQQHEQSVQDQPPAQDRVFDLSRKSRQLFGTGYSYGGGLSQGAYGGVSGYSGYSGIPTTGLGFNNGQYSTALYGGGPYGGGSYGSGVYGGGGGLYGGGLYGGSQYGGSQYGGLNGGGLYGGSGLGLNGGYGGYNQFANDPYSSFGSRGFIPSIPFRRGY